MCLHGTGGCAFGRAVSGVTKYSQERMSTARKSGSKGPETKRTTRTAASSFSLSVLSVTLSACFW